MLRTHAAMALFFLGVGANVAFAQGSNGSKAETPKAGLSAIQSPDLGFVLQRDQLRVVQDDYPDDGVTLGQGWDRFLNRKQMATCVTASVSQLTGHTIDMKLEKIEDKEHLFSALSISASAKFSGGAGSVEGSAAFSQQATVDSSNLNILATVKVDKGGRFLAPLPNSKTSDPLAVSAANIRLTDEAKILLKKPAEFQAVCGDAFVVGIREGGALNGLLKVKTYSREEKRELEIEIKAKGLSGSGEAKMNQKFEQKVENNQLDFNFMQKGGDPTITPVDAPSFIEKLRSFSKKENFEARPYLIYTLDYCNLPEVSSCSSKEKLLTPEHLDIWATHYWRLLNLEQEYGTILLNPSLYSFVSFGSPDASQARQTPVDEAAYVHDSIALSAKFLDLVLGQCARNRKCDLMTALAATLDEIRSHKTVNGFHSGGDLALIDGPLDALLLTTLGFDIAKALVSTSTTKESKETTDLLLTASLRNLVRDVSLAESKIGRRVASAGDLAMLTDPSKPIVEAALEKGVLGQDGFDWYYYWLAMKPVFRGGSLGGKTPVAAELDVRTIVKSGSKADVPDENKFLEAYQQAYQGWLFENRLFPISMSFCKVSAVHPMCLTSEKLKEIASRVPVRMPVASLRPLAPDNTQPPPRTTPAPKPPRDICHPGGGGRPSTC